VRVRVRVRVRERERERGRRETPEGSPSYLLIEIIF